jgi:hypothetical protein
MKLEHVHVGQVYLTRIGQELARVVVVCKHESQLGVDTRFRKTTFTVRRVEEQRVLPSRRTAAALKPDLNAKAPLGRHVCATNGPPITQEVWDKLSSQD